MVLFKCPRKFMLTNECLIISVRSLTKILLKEFKSLEKSTCIERITDIPSTWTLKKWTNVFNNSNFIRLHSTETICYDNLDV